MYIFVRISAGYPVQKYTWSLFFCRILLINIISKIRQKLEITAGIAHIVQNNCGNITENV